MSRATALESDFGSRWPGIGNIGIIVVDALKGILGAEELGEIEPRGILLYQDGLDQEWDLGVPGIPQQRIIVQENSG